MSAVIEERDGGPLVVKEAARLTGADGEALEAKPVMALCRCGQSNNKPFCDGSHKAAEFDSGRSDDHTPDGLRAYGGKDITVHYNRMLCSHAGECEARLKAVFDPSRNPWIVADNGSRDDIIAVVTACPSGALSYSEPDQPPQHAIDAAPGITIEENGPYRVAGIPLASARAADGGSTDKYVLCRCGKSKNKPYCDGTHHDVNWRA